MPFSGNDIQLTWWKQAAECAPDPCAFVGIDDRVTWVNPAWCRMLGYAPAEIVRMRWQEYTWTDDVGSDFDEKEKIKSGESTSYYLAKKYRHKLDPNPVPVGIFVFRYPVAGPYEGYIVFARERATQDEIAAITLEFEAIKRSVVTLQGSESNLSFNYNNLCTSVNGVYQDVSEVKSLLNSVIAGGGKGASFTIGGDYAGRNKSTTNVPTSVLIFIILAVIALGSFALGGKFSLSHGTTTTTSESK